MENNERPVVIAKKPLMQNELNARAEVVKQWLDLLKKYNAITERLGVNGVDKKQYNECLIAYEAVNRFGFENNIL